MEGLGVTNILCNYQKLCSDISFKKGIYIYGAPGTGKTHFVERILKNLNYVELLIVL